MTTLRKLYLKFKKFLKKLPKLAGMILILIVWIARIVPLLISPHGHPMHQYHPAKIVYVSAVSVPLFRFLAGNG